MRVYKLRSSIPYELEDSDYSDDKTFHSFSGELKVINFDIGPDEARFYVEDNGVKALVLGTKEALSELKYSKTDTYSVDLLYEHECVFFWMRRDKNGIWHARRENVADTNLVLGPSECISYENMKKAYYFFLAINGDPKFSKDINNAQYIGEKQTLPNTYKAP